MNVKRLFNNLSRDFIKTHFLVLILTVSGVIYNAEAKKAEPALTATPLMSSRCQALLDTRSKKIGLQQKAFSLKKRIDTLDKNIPKESFTKKKKIEVIGRKIDLKIQLLSKEITFLDEDIVRKGCPGVKL